MLPKNNIDIADMHSSRVCWGVQLFWAERIEWILDFLAVHMMIALVVYWKTTYRRLLNPYYTIYWHTFFPR